MHKANQTIFLQVLFNENIIFNRMEASYYILQSYQTINFFSRHRRGQAKHGLTMAHHGQKVKMRYSVLDAFK